MNMIVEFSGKPGAYRVLRIVRENATGPDHGRQRWAILVYLVHRGISARQCDHVALGPETSLRALIAAWRAFKRPWPAAPASHARASTSAPAAAASRAT